MAIQLPLPPWAQRPVNYGAHRARTLRAAFSTRYRRVIGFCVVFLSLLCLMLIILSLSRRGNDRPQSWRDAYYGGFQQRLPAYWDEKDMPPAFYPHENETVIATPFSSDFVLRPGGHDDARRANATLMMLCRNEELEGALRSVRQVQGNFNVRAGYPWVFLNDVPFSGEFKRKMREVIDGPVEFGVIPKEHWNQPDWIDEEKATRSREAMKRKKLPYALSVSYRNMCRWNSGFFYKHELLLPYRYYWRVEPDVSYYCNLHYDPFLYMQQNDKQYGFTISILELPGTIQTLWDAVKEFMKKYPQHVHPNNTLNFISDDGGKTYNNCHFWSNFEIADMDFYRGEAYTAFFNFLDSKGGFFYERWGDAPVHSIAISILASKKDMHYFRDIGYKHDKFSHCPSGPEHERGSCLCREGNSFNKRPSSCTWSWMNLVH